jgi:hypothetical protein
MAILTHIVSRLRRGRLLCRHFLAGLGLLLCLGPRLAAAETAPTAEYQLKAVFLFNFAQFVEWPARAFPAVDAPLVIGVLGEDPFGSYLEEIVRNERVGAHPLEIRRFKRADEAGGCHILFFSRSEADALEPAMDALRGRSVLTVSDLDSFNRKGGMVRFVMEGGKIRLRINVEAAKAGELKISSKILRPATVVTQGED